MNAHCGRLYRLHPTSFQSEMDIYAYERKTNVVNGNSVQYANLALSVQSYDDLVPSILLYVKQTG